MKRFAIVVAGGIGQRMKSSIPKQFLLLNGEPILAHTLKKFASTQIVLVLPQEHITTWESAAKTLQDLPDHTIVSGGATRSESVFKGLSQIGDVGGWVAVHDAVRPLVSPDLIETCFQSAQQWGTGVAGVPLKESLRFVDKESSENFAVDRTNFWTMQTPQTFDLGLLREAFALDMSFQATDEASLVEASGKNIKLVEGSYDNIKITSPEDLSLAEIIFKRLTQV